MLRPSPVHSGVQLVGQPSDLPLLVNVAIEVGRGRQRAGQEEGGVNRRKLAVAGSAAGFDVEEVVVKTFVAGRVFRRALFAAPKKPQRRQRDADGGVSRDQRALYG